MDIQAKEIFGGEIQYFRLDPPFWEKILIEFKEAGLRTVNTYVPWEFHMVSPPDAEHPIGTLDFTGETNPRLNLIYFLELVEKHGLNLNFRCGPFCCAEMEFGGYPKFLVRDIPEMYALTYEDKPTEGYGEGNLQPCYLHPTYLDLCRKWIDEVDKIILPHLKENGGCITMINLDNEVSYICWDTFLMTDYNPVIVGRGGYYHQFLRETYGTPDKLPYAERYTAFEDVPAPREIPEVIDNNFAYYADWLKCRTWIMSRYIAELRRMHEANGITPDKVIFMTNFCGHIPDAVPARMPDFEAATMGITGYDFYRSVFLQYWEYIVMARMLKLMTHTLKFPYASEFMSGTWRKIPRVRVPADHMRFMGRVALAHGCKAIQWYMFADRDRWNDSPVSIHGHRRPCYDVVTEMSDMLFNKMTKWDELKPVNDIAIIYDLTSHLHTAIGDPQPCNEGLIYTGKPTIDGVEAGISSREHMGLFRLAEHNSIQAANIDILFDDTALYSYPVAVHPGSPVVSHDTEEKLRRYVSSGGILAITGTIPTRYDTGETCSFLGGISVGTTEMGKGKIICLGKNLALAEAEQDELSSIEIFGDLMKTCGITPTVKISSEVCSYVDTGVHDVEYLTQPRMMGSAVLQEAEGEKVLFVMNHNPDAHLFHLEFSFPVKKLVCLTENDDVIVENNCCDIDMDRKNCQIYRVEV